jgi:hypothetical protein
MHNYSENWRHLQSISTGYSARIGVPQVYSYIDHIKAKALAVFFANATLATPKLDRTTIEAVLAGRKTWPNSTGTGRFVGPNVQLSLLESSGLVAFYTDWCTVYCQPVRGLDGIDPSLVPLIQAVEHLKDICYGRNGYIAPHYECPANELDKLWTRQFGSTPIAELLPELQLKDGRYTIPAGNQNFSSLVSTYLWLALRESLEPLHAFHRWILCLRVNCDWGMPLIFDYLEFEECAAFSKQLIDYLAKDFALCLSIDTLRKQCINKTAFLSIITPVTTHLRFAIDSEGNSSSEHEDIQLPKTTLVDIDAAYSTYTAHAVEDLQFVQQWQQFRHHWDPNLFYTSLVASVIEANVRVNGNSLVSLGTAEPFFELASSRPILKHLLLNLLPEYANPIYLIWLLSRPSTCDVALFYLSQQSPTGPGRDSQSFIEHIDKAYQYLVCYEYLRTVKQDQGNADRLYKIIDIIGNRLQLNNDDFSKSFAYQFMLCLLGSMNDQQVIETAEAYVQSLPKYKGLQDAHVKAHHLYFLGFWLIERIEDLGIDPTGKLILSLKKVLLSHYRAEFEENMTGHRSTLQPNSFFSALPWYKLIGPEGVGPLLALSNRCSDWHKSLNYSSQNCLVTASTVRHYLQVLMCVGRPQRFIENWERITIRVTEIVRTFGFGPREQAAYLFSGKFYTDQYDLWTQFCSYTNLLQENLYGEFVDRCVSDIPLDQLFVLLERCSVNARAQQLRELIAYRQSPESEDIGLSGLEQAFLSACEAGHGALADKLIDTANAFLNQEHFAKTNNPRILKARRVWITYGYKRQLMNLMETLKGDPDKFFEAARQVPLPHTPHESTDRDSDRAQRRESEHFRRYIIAAAYYETDPEKCVHIMEVLHRETKSSFHSFLLFQGRLAVSRNNGDVNRVRHALSQFLFSLGDTEPEHMPSQWVANILDAYRQLHDTSGINAFWAKLTPLQQASAEILRPYCLALITRGEPLIAQQIISRYQELNPQTSDSLGLNDLIDELHKALPPNMSISRLVQVINEDSQRSSVQLRKHYSQIVSKDFDEYVAIVGNGQASHEFLKNAMLEVAQELLLRKKNLHLHSTSATGITSYRITQEDLINDWFTSLFDKRMAEARVGLRDQKRGGQSESGNRPGESDGFITDAKNKRIAIFEAFRLFSKDTTVISQHLDKIAKYDNESLSPVFMVGYCDVKDFDALVRGYVDFIIHRDYAGFIAESKKDDGVEILYYRDYLWLGMERRRRSHREVVFYHLLLDMSL